MTKRLVQDGLVLSAGICVGVLLVKAFAAFKKEKKSATSFADLRKEEKSATSSADLRKKEGSGTSEVPHLLEGANMEEEKSATSFADLRTEEKSAFSFADLRKKEGSGTSVIPRFPEAPCPPKDTNTEAPCNVPPYRKKEGSGTSVIPRFPEAPCPPKDTNTEAPCNVPPYRKKEGSGTSVIPRFPEAPCPPKDTNTEAPCNVPPYRKKEGSGTSVIPRFPEAPCPPKDTNTEAPCNVPPYRKKEGSGTSVIPRFPEAPCPPKDTNTEAPWLPSPVFSVPDYMVKVVCFIDSSQTDRTTDTGIIIDSNGTILVRASSLYNCKAFDTTHSLKALKRQVTVILRSGGSFCGIVKHVDHVHSFAIVKIDCPVSLPTAKVLSSSSLRVGQQVLAVGITMRWTFVAEYCTIRGVHAKDKNVGINGKCQNFFHVDWKFKEAMPTQPGLFATLNGEVVGLKRAECPRDGGLVHGLPIECIAEILQDVKEHSTHILRCLAGVADVSSSMNVSLMKTQSQEYEGGVETAATDGKIKKPERVLSLPIMFLLDKPLQLYEEEVETVSVL